MQNMVLLTKGRPATSMVERWPTIVCKPTFATVGPTEPYYLEKCPSSTVHLTTHNRTDSYNGKKNAGNTYKNYLCLPGTNTEKYSHRDSNCNVLNSCNSRGWRLDRDREGLCNYGQAGLCRQRWCTSAWQVTPVESLSCVDRILDQ